jgi:hypothetical protein
LDYLSYVYSPLQFKIQYQGGNFKSTVHNVLTETGEVESLLVPRLPLPDSAHAGQLLPRTAIRKGVARNAGHHTLPAHILISISMLLPHLERYQQQEEILLVEAISINS